MDPEKQNSTPTDYLFKIIGKLFHILIIIFVIKGLSDLLNATFLGYINYSGGRQFTDEAPISLGSFIGILVGLGWSVFYWRLTDRDKKRAIVRKLEWKKKHHLALSDDEELDLSMLKRELELDL